MVFNLRINGTIIVAARKASLFELVALRMFPIAAAEKILYEASEFPSEKFLLTKD